MKELTYEEFCALSMSYTFGLALETGAFRQYSNFQTGLSRETYTPRNPDTGKWGKTKVWYYFKGGKEIYKTSDQIYLAYMKKVCRIKT